MQIGTPLGLALASGLNAYLPLLSLALANRFLHLYKVNPNFPFVTSDWFIILLVILSILDFAADKIPLIEHAWNAVHTVIRPIAGIFVAAASTNQVTLPINISAISSSLFREASIIVISDMRIAGLALLIVIALLGGILAAISHAAKSTTRIISTFTTAGFLNAILSIGEDVLVVIAVLLSLFVPLIMLILIVLFLLVFGPYLFRLWSGRLSSPRSL